MEKGVSIIIPTRSTPKFLYECIESIFRYKVDFKFEILIGIDQCGDTLNHVKENKNFYEKVKIYYFDEHVGPYTIKNNLVNVTTYEYILFFDSDDIMNIGMLENFYKEIPNYDLIRFRFRAFTEDINKLHKLHDIGYGIIGIKKLVFNKLNGFQNWVCAADTEFIGRIENKKLDVGVIEDVCFFRRLHGENLTLKKETKHGSEIRKSYVQILEEKQRENKWENPHFKKVSFNEINFM